MRIWYLYRAAANGLGSELVALGFILNRNWHQFKQPVPDIVDMQDIKETRTKQVQMKMRDRLSRAVGSPTKVLKGDMFLFLNFIL